MKLTPRRRAERPFVPEGAESRSAVRARRLNACVLAGSLVTHAWTSEWSLDGAVEPPMCPLEQKNRYPGD
jgi:hypothetical protein